MKVNPQFTVQFSVKMSSLGGSTVDEEDATFELTTLNQTQTIHDDQSLIQDAEKKKRIKRYNELGKFTYKLKRKRIK